MYVIYVHLFIAKGPVPPRTIIITIMMPKERILLVESACADFAWSNSTNRTRSLCVVIVIILVIAAVGPGLTVQLSQQIL